MVKEVSSIKFTSNYGELRELLTSTNYKSYPLVDSPGKSCSWIFFKTYIPVLQIHCLDICSSLQVESHNFYAVAMKWLRHIVLPCSVIPSSFTFQSQQHLHTFYSNLIYGCILWIYSLSLKWFWSIDFWQSFACCTLQKNEKFSFFAL